MAYNWLIMTSFGDNNWPSRSLGLLTDKTKNTEKQDDFANRVNRALLTVRSSQNSTKYLATTFYEKTLPGNVKIGNNRDCVIQSWRSAWIVRDFISHSLHSVVASFAIGDMFTLL